MFLNINNYVCFRVFCAGVWYFCVFVFLYFLYFLHMCMCHPLVYAYSASWLCSQRAYLCANIHVTPFPGGRGCLLDCSMTEGVSYLSTFISHFVDSPLMFNTEYGLFSGRCPIYRWVESLCFTSKTKIPNLLKYCSFQRAWKALCERDFRAFPAPHFAQHKSIERNALTKEPPCFSCYETRDGRHMAVGAIEPKFHRALFQGWPSCR